jgi:hypothetical protein
MSRFKLGDLVVYLDKDSIHYESLGKIVKIKSESEYLVHFNKETPLFIINENYLEPYLQYQRDKKLKSLLDGNS